MPTRTISTKLAIEGESQYRAALSKINSEIKTLQSSLRLTESQYQTNANSMQALTAKGEALGALYTAQKNKVEELRAALSNAKAAEEEYARQKSTLISKIEENNRKLEELRSTSGDTTAQEKALTEENKELEKQLEKCDASLSATEKGVNSWQTQLNNAEIKLNDLDAEIQQNDKYLAEAKTSTDGCARSIDEFGNKVAESADKTEQQGEALEALAGALAAAGIKEGLEKIKEALEACVTAAADFEYAMSGVAAIANASNDEISALTEKAQAIGASTVFTASQAAEALQYMALAGWNSQEMLAGVDGVINLAAASGENLGTVSDIVTDALTAFGLSAADTSHFVDVLAQASANSNTTVTMLGEAFKYAAPVAGALGYSVEDVATAMGLMANNGIKGSMAGTAMRTMFTKLTDDVVLSADAFGEVTISAANADGTMKPLSQTLAEMRGYFDQMTEVEKTSNAQAIAGQRAYAGLLAILNSTEEDYASLSAAIQDCTGAAQKMADVRMDNLQGDVTILQSAMDGLKIEIGNQLTPALRELTQTGTDVVDWAHNFIAEHEGMVETITILVTVMGVAVGTLTALSVAAGVLKTAMGALNTVLMANPWILAATAVAALATAVIGFSASVASDAIPTASDFNEAARSMADTVADIDTAFTENRDSIEGTALQAEHYIDVLEEIEAGGLETAEAQETYRQTVEKLNAILPELNLTLDEQTGLVNGGTAAIREQVTAWRDLAVQEALQQRYKETLDQVAAVEAERYANLAKLNQAEVDHGLIQDSISDKQLRMNELQAQMNDLIDAGSGGSESYKDLASEYESLSNECIALNDELILNESLQDELAKAIQDDTDAIEEQQGVVDEATEALRLFDEEQGNAAESAEELTFAIGDIMESVDDLTKAFKDEYDAAYSSLKGQSGLTGTFKEELDEANDSLSDMMNRWKENADAMENFAENIRAAREAGLDPQLIEDFANGGSEGAAMLAQALKDLDSGVTTVESVNAAYQSSEEAAKKAALEVALANTDIETAMQVLAEAAQDADFEDFYAYAEEALEAYGFTLEDVGMKAEAFASSTDAALSGTQEAVGAAQEAVDSLSTDNISNVAAEAEQAAADTEAAYENVGAAGESSVASAEATAASVTESSQAAAAAAEESSAAIDAEYQSLKDSVSAKLEELRGVVNQNASELYSAGNNAGMQLINGIIAGLNSRASTLYARLRSIINNAIEAGNAEAQIASPSKRTTRSGEFITEGYVVGMEAKKKKVADAAQDVINTALTVPKVTIPDLSSVMYAGTAQMDRLVEAMQSRSSASAAVVNKNVTLNIAVQQMDEANTNYVIRRVNEALGGEIG